MLFSPISGSPFIRSRSSIQVKPTSNTQKAFTLIEILVALVLISIGFLGMLGMQSFSLQQSQDTYFSNKANFLARDIADRMRINSSGLNHYIGYDTETGGDEDSCSTADSSCNIAQMANFDKAIWRAGVISLPNGNGLISSVDPDVPNLFEILISWEEKKNNLNRLEQNEDLCGSAQQGGEPRRCIRLRVYI